MLDSHNEEVFAETRGSLSRWLIGGVAAVVIGGLLLVGYGFLRKRHAERTAQLEAQAAAEPKASPKALILVDEAMMQGDKSLVGGSVKNISNEKLNNLSVELELKRRKDGVAEKKSIALDPGYLEPNQEGHYSVELRSQDYGSARLIGLKVGATPLPFTTGQGKKRPLERLETKTVTVGKPSSSKRDEFLNSPDKPTRVP